MFHHENEDAVPKETTSTKITTNDFSNTYSLGAGRADSLNFAIAAVLQLPQLGGLVAFVKTDTDFVSGSHVFLLQKVRDQIKR